MEQTEKPDGMTTQQRAWWGVLLDPDSTPEERAEAHQWLEDEGL